MNMRRRVCAFFPASVSPADMTLAISKSSITAMNTNGATAGATTVGTISGHASTARVPGSGASNAATATNAYSSSLNKPKPAIKRNGFTASMLDNETPARLTGNQFVEAPGQLFDADLCRDHIVKTRWLEIAREPLPHHFAHVHWAVG